MRIVAFGNSITEGRAGGITPEQNWLTLLSKKLGGDFEFFNAGVGGNSAREAMARFERDVLSRDPDVVLLEFGGNNHDPAPERKARRVSDSEFRSLLEKFKAGLPAKCQVVMITFPPVINEQHQYFSKVPAEKWMKNCSHNGRSSVISPLKTVIPCWIFTKKSIPAGMN